VDIKLMLNFARPETIRVLVNGKGELQVHGKWVDRRGFFRSTHRVHRFGYRLGRCAIVRFGQVISRFWFRKPRLFGDQFDGFGQRFQPDGEWRQFHLGLRQLYIRQPQNNGMYQH